MIFVDSSVWIDYLRDVPSVAARLLDQKLGVEPILIGDLVLTEVLQGITDERRFQRIKALMVARGRPIVVGGLDVAIAAAENYRVLRGRGITPRKTIDTLIATRCIKDGYRLLYSDRAFDPFVQYLGLQSALPLL